MEELFNQLLSMMAEHSTHEELADRMEEAIKEYRDTGNFRKIEYTCAIIMKKSIQDAVGGAEAERKRYDEFNKIANVFDHTKNQS
jgi:hypothetical protein